MKAPMMKQLLSAINNLTLPDLSFSGGFLNKNKLFVDQQA
jgi:hypothetical protein